MKSIFNAVPQKSLEDRLNAMVPKVTATPAEKVSVPVAVVGKLRQFRVKKERNITWMGCMTRMPVGAIIDDSSYGPGGVDKLRDQGLELEEV